MCGANNRGESDRHPLWMCPPNLAKLCWAVRCDPVERFKKLAAFCKTHGLKEEVEFYQKSIAALTSKPQPSDLSSTALPRAQEVLLKEFEGFLQAPKTFAQRVTGQCKEFPEGDLFPYLLPAMAYGNLAIADPKKKAAYTLGGRIDPDSTYYTGFLFGDACLFYNVTYVPWTQKLLPKAEP